MNDDYLMHYGKGHLDGGHSGRYPWGSGDDPYQRYRDWLSEYRRYTAKGLSEKEIAEKMGVYNRRGKPSAEALRQHKRVAVEQADLGDRMLAKRLAAEGKTATEIGAAMGRNESTIRGWLKTEESRELKSSAKTAAILKDLADKKTYVDVSAGAENWLGITHNNLQTAEYRLQAEGYNIYTIKVPQMESNHMTTFSVLVPPGVTYSDAIANRLNIKPIYDESRTVDADGVVLDTGLGKSKIHSISADRIKVIYNEEGGVDKDGLIEIRPGVDDISIGAKRYAQVRIPVEDSYYLKGMAVYKDDIPKGYDIIVNSNKHLGTPIMGEGDSSVFKKMKRHEDGSVDWENPFGASVTQLEYTGADGKKHYSAANIVNQEGDWIKWSRNVSSQLGSKQAKDLTERQLKLDYLNRKQEFDEIMALTNPTIKRKLLIEFGDKCDTAAVELKGAPFPGQQQHAIIPEPKMKDNEIYAPQYADGTVVALVRHPYAGPFESPVLTVRNTGSIGKKIIGANAPDAVVINKHVADQMSGADFDGDTVAVIPLNDRTTLKTQKPLAGLKDFDHQDIYRGYEGMTVIPHKLQQKKMGEVTNLITDMTLKGAPQSDIVKAVKHSMVIIDSEKHELDWKRSEADNDIIALKKTYQDAGDGRTGAGTIISRAGAPYQIPERKPWSPSSKSINPDGSKKFETTDATYTMVKLKGTKVVDPDTKRSKTVYPEEADNSGWIGTFTDKRTGALYYTKKDPTTGKKVRVDLTPADYTKTKEAPRMQEVKRMSVESDAFTLTSGGSKRNPGYPIEKVYAQYANEMKALGNLARKAWLGTIEQKKDPRAAKAYAPEVESLETKLRDALRHAPQERQALLMANRTMAIRRQDNPNMDEDHEKKYKRQAINLARLKLGVSRKSSLIKLTDREWEAIQSRALSPSKIKQIIDHTDPTELRKRATPKAVPKLSPTMKALAKSMAAAGYTGNEIADRLGVSTTTVYKVVSGEDEKK